jgi:hypothetical protein
MLFVSKITPIFALLTFKEKELAHQAYSSAPCQLGGLFLSHPARGYRLNRGAISEVRILLSTRGRGERR